MSYGGGTWLVQNKVLPGTYINFQSLSRAELIFSDRGYAAIGLELDWGADGEIFTVENGDFIENSTKFFGYSYDNEKLKGLRDFYKHAQTGYIYKLNSGGTLAISGVNDKEIQMLNNSNADKIISGYNCRWFLWTIR